MLVLRLIIAKNGDYARGVPVSSIFFACRSFYIGLFPVLLALYSATLLDNTNHYSLKTFPETFCAVYYS